MAETASILYTSRDRLLATPAGMPRRKYPLPQQAPNQFAAYAFDCDFTQRLDQFPPAPKNTPSSYSNAGTIPFGLGDDNAILTSLTQPSDKKANTGEFTGTFHIVPAPWDDFISQTVTFPGIRDAAYTGGVRDPKPLTVLTRQHREYFVAEPGNVLAPVDVKDSAGNPIIVVASKGLIPTLYRTPWRFLVAGVIQTGSEVTGLVKDGGTGGFLETVPNTETFLAWCAVASDFVDAMTGATPVAWDPSHPPVWDGLIDPVDTIGQYRISDSRIEDYAGNIFCRVTEYVLAQ